MDLSKHNDKSERSDLYALEVLPEWARKLKLLLEESSYLESRV